MKKKQQIKALQRLNGFIELQNGKFIEILQEKDKVIEDLRYHYNRRGIELSEISRLHSEQLLQLNDKIAELIGANNG